MLDKAIRLYYIEGTVAQTLCSLSTLNWQPFSKNSVPIRVIFTYSLETARPPATFEARGHFFHLYLLNRRKQSQCHLWSSCWMAL